MKTLAHLVMFMLALLISKAVYSGSVTNTTITQIRVDNDGRAMIFFNHALSPTATCINTVYSKALGIDAATPGGQAVLSMALAAKASGATVVAHGFGTCGVYGGSVIETWDHGFIKERLKNPRLLVDMT